MPKIEKWIIDKVLDATRIEDVIGEFVTLRKAGVNMTGLCPFHDDRTDGNFIVRPSTIAAKNHGNTYRCFVCDAKGDAVKFLMEQQRMTFPDAIRWLGKKYNIEVDDVPINYTPPPPRPVPPPPPPLLLPRSWVKRTMEVDYNRNIFTYWLAMLPWSDQQRARLRETLWMYCVGGWRDGRVVFWMIDHEGNPRAAKLMRYLQDGHRDKAEHPGWIYNQDGCRQIAKPDEHTILKPLFGSHLLSRYPKAVVNVVESEKTAIIMQNYYGSPESGLWLACGGLKHLQLEAMQPLIDQGRQVWLWPDKDGVDEWQEVADKLGSPTVKVYTRFFDTCWEPEDGDKADAADITIRILRHPEWRPREVKTSTGDGTGTTEIIAKAGVGSGVAPSPTPESLEWNSDEPFLDPEEMTDPRVHQWREILRQRYNFNKSRPKPPTCNVEGVQSVGEILQEHPLIKKLLE